jgi:biopolymer transport protein TolR
MKKNSKIVSQLNVVPYIDVMLVLLLVFILSSPTINHGVDIDLPSGEDSPVQVAPDDRVIFVSVGKDGGITIKDINIGLTNTLTEEELFKWMTVSNRKYENLKVYVRGDKNSIYNNIMRVIRIIKKSGIKRVNLVTDPN